MLFYIFHIKGCIHLMKVKTKKWNEAHEPKVQGKLVFQFAGNKSYNTRAASLKKRKSETGLDIEHFQPWCAQPSKTQRYITYKRYNNINIA